MATYDGAARTPDEFWNSEFAGPYDGSDREWIVNNHGAIIYYINRVYDTVAAGFVRWTTTPNPDNAGASYPGPGAFGGDTSDYCVETVFSA